MEIQQKYDLGENVRVIANQCAVRFMDVTDAGKKGKTVTEVSLYEKFGGDQTMAFILGFLTAVGRGLPFPHLVDFIRSKEDEIGLKGVGVQIREIKAIEVKPSNFEELNYYSEKVIFHAGWRGFTVRCQIDTLNEPVAISRKSTAGKKGSDLLKKMVSNGDIAGMSFTDIVRVFMNNNIDFHQYCAMD